MSDSIRVDVELTDNSRLVGEELEAAVFCRGGRVELIPVKDGVKVVRVRREEVRGTSLTMRGKSGKI